MINQKSLERLSKINEMLKEVRKKEYVELNLNSIMVTCIEDADENYDGTYSNYSQQFSYYKLIEENSKYYIVDCDEYGNLEADFNIKDYDNIEKGRLSELIKWFNEEPVMIK